MIFLYILLTALLSSSAFCEGGVEWTIVQPRETLKSKTKVWQVQVATEEGKPLIYLVQSTPARIRIFYAHTRYHHPLDLSRFGIHQVTDVGLAEPLKGRGQVLYLGDRSKRRILYVVLGKKRIREFPLTPGIKAYKEFVERLHPIAEAERHF